MFCLYFLTRRISHLFQFANLLGSVYHKGNLVFAPDGETILSPVGNKVTLYDLKRLVTSGACKRDISWSTWPSCMLTLSHVVK